MPPWLHQLIQVGALFTASSLLINTALWIYFITDYRKYLKHQKAQQNL